MLGFVQTRARSSACCRYFQPNPLRAMPVGPQKIILVRSGLYEYAEVDINGAIQIVGPNNTGKSTLIKTLQFLYLNDRRVGSVWAPPYAIDVTGQLRPGANRIRIDVANLAVNYSSQGGSGQVGAGWAVSGLSRFKTAISAFSKQTRQNTTKCRDSPRLPGRCEHTWPWPAAFTLKME